MCVRVPKGSQILRLQLAGGFTTQFATCPPSSLLSAHALTPFQKALAESHSKLCPPLSQIGQAFDEEKGLQHHRTMSSFLYSARKSGSNASKGINPQSTKFDLGFEIPAPPPPGHTLKSRPRMFGLKASAKLPSGPAPRPGQHPVSQISWLCSSEKLQDKLAARKTPKAANASEALPIFDQSLILPAMPTWEAFRLPTQQRTSLRHLGTGYSWSLRGCGVCKGSSSGMCPCQSCRADHPGGSPSPADSVLGVSRRHPSGCAAPKSEPQSRASESRDEPWGENAVWLGPSWPLGSWVSLHAFVHLWGQGSRLLVHLLAQVAQFRGMSRSVCVKAVDFTPFCVVDKTHSRRLA